VIDTDNLIAVCIFSFFAMILSAVCLSDYQSKSYRANCIVAMKDRPATDILAVCK